MVPIVVFASGRGSNLIAIQKSIERNELQAKIIAVISDRPEAQVLDRAREFNIPTLCIPVAPVGSGPESGMTKEARRLEHEEKIVFELKKLNPRFLVLAGYMRVMTSRLIDAYRCDQGYVRIVNIHPSILPSFSGIHSYAQAFRYGGKVTGVTVHLVETEVDAGPICAQEAFSIADCKTEAEVEQRGLAVEHRLFPKTLEWVLPEKFSLEQRSSEGRFCVRPN